MYISKIILIIITNLLCAIEDVLDFIDCTNKAVYRSPENTKKFKCIHIYLQLARNKIQ